MKKTNTLVLTLQELYNVVPAAGKLEGTNFKDMKDLLVQLIGAIEHSDYEFVQYIQQKPSLFVIRQRFEEAPVYNPIVNKPRATHFESTPKVVESEDPNDKYDNTEERTSNSVKPIPAAKKEKMPWEK